MVVVYKVIETADISSFHLQDPDKGPMPQFKPGQYISVVIPKGEIEGDSSLFFSVGIN